MKPQYIKINEQGDKFYYSDAAMKILHRTDGPAIEYPNGGKEWYVDDKRHRTDGPAIEYPNGTKAWYVDNKRHRTDGPAIEYPNGGKEWYADDKELTEKAFNNRFEAVELTLDQIASKFGIDVNNLKIVK